MTTSSSKCLRSERLAQSPANSKHSLIVCYLWLLLIYCHKSNNTCLLSELGTWRPAQQPQLAERAFTTCLPGRQWRRLKAPRPWQSAHFTLSVCAGIRVGPSSMQTLTLSCNPKIKNKLGFESKAIGAFDLGHKARQLLDTKALIYLWNVTDIFKAGTKKLTEDQALIATQWMTAFKHKPPECPLFSAKSLSSLALPSEYRSFQQSSPLHGWGK